MLSYNEDTFPKSMRGRMKLPCGTAEFLEKLSRNGATHHSAFVYGATVEELSWVGTSSVKGVLLAADGSVRFAGAARKGSLHRRGWRSDTGRHWCRDLENEQEALR